MTPYQIAETTDHLIGRANTAAINRIFRKQDNSQLWPINGRFNATERAIRKVRSLACEGGFSTQGLEYALALDSCISQIVNNEA